MKSLMKVAILAVVVASEAAWALVAPQVPATRRTMTWSEKGFGKAKPTKKRSPPAADPVVVVEADDERPEDDSKSQEAIFAKYGVQSADAMPPAPPERPPPRLLDVVPPSVQIGLERFLVGGIVVLLVAFIVIGLGITYEAFASSTKNPLPPDQQALIVDVLEPAFTPTLVGGFACSITLGILKTLQLTSEKSQYSETYSEKKTKK